MSVLQFSPRPIEPDMIQMAANLPTHPAFTMTTVEQRRQWAHWCHGHGFKVISIGQPCGLCGATEKQLGGKQV